MKRQQTEFPYRAKVGSTVVIITGRHYTGLLETNGFGLIPASSAVPVEGQEMPRNRSESTAIESERAKPWKQGCFKQRL